MATSERVHCARIVEVDGELVDRGFDVMISAATIYDEELITWAEERERKNPAGRRVPKP